MYGRRLAAELRMLLAESPAVALTGPRQAGKTTLALEVAAERAATYLDLESPRDAALLAEPELYFDAHGEGLLILDEVQRVPSLFPVLRGVIDRRRRAGQQFGQFLLLGSASIDLIAGSSESLAGRLAITELGTLSALEVPASRHNDLWVRGGFPPSLDAAGAEASLRWREAFISTYLERDVPAMGPRIPSTALRRLWTMLAHQQGGQLNVAQLAAALGVSGQTAGRYIDVLADLLLVRRLPPVMSNVGKRMTKAPKVYVRDSGLVHALLGITTLDDLLSHPVAGMSWEGHVIEQLLQAAGDRVDVGFYRSSGGAEIDLVLTWPGGETWAIEIKRTATPSVGRGFRSAVDDLQPARSFFACPVEAECPLAPDVTAIPPVALAELVAARR
ncbi:MAG: ATP-binding protein [Patulibacter sp.]